MFKLIAADVMIEELNKRAMCESCGLLKSEFLYISKHSYCSVLAHVCKGCKIDLSVLDDGAEKEFMLKDPINVSGR